MNRTVFYNTCPRTRVEFIKKFNSDRIFKNTAKIFGFSVIGDNVIFPTGRVANANVK